MLKIYAYGYLNCMRSSRRLERESNRNVELIWLTEGLAPDFKTIADFRKDNRKAIKEVFKDFLRMSMPVSVGKDFEELETPQQRLQGDLQD